MKLKELIEKLNKYSQDNEVEIYILDETEHLLHRKIKDVVLDDKFYNKDMVILKCHD